MEEKVKIPYNEVDFVWETSRYDIPLGGLCRYEDNLCEFKGDYDTLIYTIYSLTTREKIKFLYRKKLFEICVGYHCSYPQRLQGANFYYKRPRWFWKLVCKLYYKRNPLRSKK